MTLRVLIRVPFPQAEQRRQTSSPRCIAFIGIITDKQNIFRRTVQSLADSGVTRRGFFGTRVRVKPLMDVGAQITIYGVLIQKLLSLNAT